MPRIRQRLHVMPTSAGYEIRSDRSYDWNGRKRGQTPFTVLQHTISGHGNLRYGNRSFRIGAGETMLLVIPHGHRYWVEDGERWEFFWISMNGEEALRIHRDVLAAAGPIFRLHDPTIDHLADCASRLVTEAANPAQASAIAYEALMALYGDIFDTHTGDQQENPVLRRVIDYIAQNLDKPLPVNELAKLSGQSRAHFSRTFAIYEGVPPAEFVMRKRLERAVKLLTKTADLSVKDVSNMCGFDDPNYFAKVFRRAFGSSPTEFRTSGMYANVGSRIVDLKR